MKRLHVHVSVDDLAAWITDPQGLSWETFLTSGESTVYGDSADLGPIRVASAPCCRTEELCCGPNSGAA